MWSLVKCREAGATKEQLVSIYIARVISTLEYACQVYDPLLNESQSLEIESVQRNCLQIILGVSSGSYATNMSVLNLSSLADRRRVLVKQFAISYFRSIFHRWCPTRFLVPKCKLQRDHKRPLVAYTEVLNEISDDEWKLLRLPPVSSVHNVDNKQLPDLARPSFMRVDDDALDGVSTVVPSVCDVDVPEVPGVVVDIVACSAHGVGMNQCHPECYPGL